MADGDSQTISKPDRVIATLLLSIDQELSAKVLRHFSDEAVERITRAMQELQELAVDRETIRQSYVGAVQRLRQGNLALGDVGSTMQNVLVKAFGESRGADVS